MNEQTQDDTPLESQPPEQPTSGEQPPEEVEPVSSVGAPVRQATTKTVRALEFLAGFLGWYLVSLVFYGQKMDAESVIICGGVLFPVNVVILILLLRKVRSAGWGMLAALAVNLVISIFLGQGNSGGCFVPFYRSP